MEALITRNQQEKIFRIAFVASSRDNVEGLARARRLGVATKILPYHRGIDVAEAELERLWQNHDLDVVALAGFMKILSPDFTRRHEGRILNIHPSLLPLFSGAHALDDFWSSGQSTSGVTVHLVDELMDHGPVLRQAPLQRKSDESYEDFEARLHQLEHRIYWDALKDFAASLDSQTPHYERSISQ